MAMTDEKIINLYNICKGSQDFMFLKIKEILMDNTNLEEFVGKKLPPELVTAIEDLFDKQTSNISTKFSLILFGMFTKFTNDSILDVLEFDRKLLELTAQYLFNNNDPLEEVLAVLKKEGIICL
jgi:hypothetical protein